MVRLTKAQIKMLQAASDERGAGAASFYPPVKKLLALGFIEDKPLKFGSRYYITAVGRAALSEVKP
jgi:hypothetical protein